MNNQEDSGSEKRLLLAVVLSMAVLFMIPYISQTIYPPPPVAPQDVIQEETASLEQQPESLPDSSEPEVFPETGDNLEDLTSAVPETRTIETDDLVIEFTNQGAGIKSIRLRGYANEFGEPLQLIPQDLNGNFGTVLSLSLEDRNRGSQITEGTYEMSVERGLESTDVLFSYRDNQFQVEKRITVPQQGFELSIQGSVRERGISVPYRINFGAGIGPLRFHEQGDFLYPSAAYYQAGSVERYDTGDLEDGPVEIGGNIRWAGLDSKYFAMILIEPGSIRDVLMTRQEWTTKLEDGSDNTIYLVGAAVGVPVDGSARVFMGPKSHEALGATDSTLRDLINYGWFGVLVKPLLSALKFIFGYIGNWGWAIILLTFLINLALFPVRYKQMASMEKMSSLQPQLRSIQDKYKRMKRDDPRKQQMNAEVMALYKQHGVNPLGGCLPLLLQMPILFAFYRMLDASIELRGAPFIFWIQDLSKADPYYVTPIVMGATMVAQQKMTPATGDPTQRRMMMMLPIVFTFFFLNVSSGLAIYFLFSNVFAMMFQFGLKRLKSGEADKSKRKQGAGAKKK